MKKHVKPLCMHQKNSTSTCPAYSSPYFSLRQRPVKETHTLTSRNSPLFFFFLVLAPLCAQALIKRKKERKPKHLYFAAISLDFYPEGSKEPSGSRYQRRISFCSNRLAACSSPAFQSPQPLAHPATYSSLQPSSPRTAASRAQPLAWA